MIDEETRTLLRHIAANVRKLRDRAGLTQEQLAERLQIGPRALQDIEAARANLTMATLVSIARALDVKRPIELLRSAKLEPTRTGRPPSRKR